MPKCLKIQTGEQCPRFISGTDTHLQCVSCLDEEHAWLGLRSHLNLFQEGQVKSPEGLGSRHS